MHLTYCCFEFHILVWTGQPIISISAESSSTAVCRIAVVDLVRLRSEVRRWFWSTADAACWICRICELVSPRSWLCQRTATAPCMIDQVDIVGGRRELRISSWCIEEATFWTYDDRSQCNSIPDISPSADTCMSKWWSGWISPDKCWRRGKCCAGVFWKRHQENHFYQHRSGLWFCRGRRRWDRANQSFQWIW